MFWTSFSTSPPWGVQSHDSKYHTYADEAEMDTSSSSLFPETQTYRALLMQHLLSDTCGRLNNGCPEHIHILVLATYMCYL